MWIVCHDLSKYFWADVVSIACYVINRVLIRSILKKTPYELYKGRKHNIYHLYIFGCECFVLNNGKNNLGNFDAKSDEGILVGYSSTSKLFRVYNKITWTIEESMHVFYEESNPRMMEKEVDDLIDSQKNTYHNEQIKKQKRKTN